MINTESLIRILNIAVIAENARHLVIGKTDDGDVARSSDLGALITPL